MFNRIAVAALLSVPAVASAGDWSGEAAAGYLATSGNAETSSLNAKFGLNYLAGPWKNALLASAVSSSDEGSSTAERYFVGNKLDYGFTERDYVFLALEFEKDLFGGIRQRTSETVGYGRHLLLGPVHKLDAEIGAGVRQTEEQLTGDTHDDVIGRGALTYGWKISDSSAFAQLLKTESGESNTYVESVSELKLTIIGSLAAALSYTVKHNTDVPAGTEKTDTFTAVNLAYGFGAE
jgi:putative salt-induced outer membrane protein